MTINRKAIARTLRAAAARLEGGLMLSAGVKYDPENPVHRQELADKMKEKLGAAGFKLSSDRTLDPGRQYGGWKGKEEVWVFQHRKDPGLEVQVFTSITQGGAVRSKGADAIRVCLVYKNKAKQTGTENPDARQYDLGSECRVHRTGDIDDIVERTVERARDAYKRANEVDRCRVCQAPMATSKAGKAFCSEVCWTKKPGYQPKTSASTVFDITRLSKTERAHLREWSRSGSETHVMPKAVAKSLIKLGIVVSTRNFDVQKWQKNVKSMPVVRFISPEVGDEVFSALRDYDATLSASSKASDLGASVSGSAQRMRKILALGSSPWTIEEVEAAWRQYKAQRGGRTSASLA